MSDDPYRPPDSHIESHEYRKLPKDFIPTLLLPVFVSALMPLILKLGNEAIQSLCLFVYPFISIFCGAVCAQRLRAARGGSGCFFTLAWLGLLAFYAITFFVGCVASLALA